MQDVDTPTPSRVASGVLIAVLLATTVMLGLAFLQKSPCITGDWGETVQYKSFCYSDIFPLYGGQVSEGRLPYFDDCPGELCDEYPPGTMYAMWLAAQPVTTENAFFGVNALMLAACALGTAFILVRLTGRRAYYFALAPALIVYAFLNWDLIAIVVSVLGIWAFIRERYILAGAMLALGIATKLFPVLFLIGMLLDLIRKKRWENTVDVAGSAAVTWFVVNAPFIIYAREGWLRFFKFNSERYLNFESTWAPLCDFVLPVCSTDRLNLWSAVAFLAGTVIVCRLALRDGRGRLWTLGMPIFIMFLLTNKVYSPQYSLWMAPWFALALPSIPLFIAFSVADLAVFFTIFSFFGTKFGLAGFTHTAVHIAVVIRVVVLIAVLVAYFRRRRRYSADPVLAG